MPPALEQALAQLCARQQRSLEELIAEARRTDELCAALPGDALPPGLASHQAEIATAILGLVKGWQALGGGLRLTPPPGLAPLPQVEVLPTTPASPHPPDEPAEPVAVVAPTPPAAPPRPALVRRAPHPTPPPAPASPARDWSEDLGSLLLGLKATSHTSDELNAIQRAANASFVRWSRYPRSVQRALVGNLACRLRHLQDHLGLGGPRLDTAFRSLTRFSKSSQPGWVNGLTRGRGPAAESWEEEARCWWDQLVLSAERAVDGAGTEPLAAGPQREEAIEGVRSWIEEWRQAPAVAKRMCMEKALQALEGARRAGVPIADPELCRLAGEIYDHLELPRFRNLRRAIRDLEQAEREETEGAAPDGPPSEWPWWSHTVGRRALLLAPEVDHETMERVEHCFGLVQLSWRRLDESTHDVGEVGALLGSGIDLVLVLGDDPDDALLRAAIRACQVRGTPWVHVEHGLGVVRVRMAIERFLHPDPRADVAAAADDRDEECAEE
ncbi:MAG: hypothetical protein ABIO70_09490 [Pseudomonadota bacterium]